MLNLFVNGISGKMGSSIINLVSNIENVLITDSIIDCDVVVYFSRPESSLNIINKCIENKKPIVIGTTGFNDGQLQIIKEASQDIPVLLSYNMSKGIFFLKESIKDFLHKNQHNFECVIHEVHHTEKVDSPSGTAIELEKTIQNNDTNKQYDNAINIQYDNDRAAYCPSPGVFVPHFVKIDPLSLNSCILLFCPSFCYFVLEK